MISAILILFASVCYTITETLDKNFENSVFKKLNPISTNKKETT